MTPAEVTAQIAALQTRLTGQHVTNTGADDGPGERIDADTDGDWVAAREENRRWRQLP